MGNARIAALEAQLRARWDLETLAVYADALEVAGDPRGELIALDLKIAAGATDLFATRTERMAAWLGDTSGLGDGWTPGEIRWGFLECFSFTLFDTTLREKAHALLASPVAPYVRKLVLQLGARALEETLDLLASRSWPWLESMTIAKSGGEHRALPRRVTEAFSAAVPHLVELDLRGHRIWKSPCPPSVRTIRLDRASALALGGPMPDVTELDLVFSVETQHGLAGMAVLTSPRLFPALRKLDLSRNEHTYPTTFDGNKSTSPFVLAVEDFDRITHLRLPSIRDRADVEAVLALLQQYPTLQIEIARMYSDTVFQGVVHPRLRVPPCRRWPSRDVVSGADAVTVVEVGEELALSSIIDELETKYEVMPVDAQRAWDAFWHSVSALGWEDDASEPVHTSFDAATLIRALVTLPRDDRCTYIADALVEGELPPDAVVTLARYRG